MARVVGLLLDLGEWCFENPGATAVLMFVAFIAVIALVDDKPTKKEVV